MSAADRAAAIAAIFALVCRSLRRNARYRAFLREIPDERLRQIHAATVEMLGGGGRSAR